MAKMTEKQVNIMAISIGVVLFIAFAVLSYMDFEEMDILKQQQAAVQGEIDGANAKKQEIPKLKSQLYVYKEGYDFVKQKLPDKREILKFYETLDQFRLGKNMDAWRTFQARSTEVLENPEDVFKVKGKDKDKNKAKQPQAAPAKPAGPGTLVVTEYGANIPATLNQLGELLATIEAYPRFYGVTSFSIPGMDLETSKGIPIADINLTLVSFSYPEKTTFDEAIVSRLLKDFKESPNEKKELQNFKEKWQKTPFQWTPLSRNPFNREEVLVREAKAGETTVVKPVGPVTVEPDAVAKEINELEKVRNQNLLPFVVAGLWLELQSKMAELQYEDRLTTRMVIKPEVEQALVQKVEKMRAELREWKIQIKQVGVEEKARQFAGVAEKKTQEMEVLYLEGKDRASVETLDRVVRAYNEMLPQLKEYEHLENKMPQLQAVRKRAEELYTKADTQKQIIQQVAKLELQGVIYWANQPQYSVAFINNKVLRKDDAVITSFTIHEIREGEVVLKYREETVPIRLKRVQQAMLQKSKQ